MNSQRSAVLLEEGLVGLHHAIEPRKELLGAVVGVKNNGDTVGGGNGADVVSGSNGTGDGSLLVLVVDTLTGEVGSTTLGNLFTLLVTRLLNSLSCNDSYLEDDGSLVVAGSLERGNDGGRRSAVLEKVRKSSIHVKIDSNIQWQGWRTSSPGRT